MKVMMPDEVEERNIITKRELQAIIEALNHCADPQVRDFGRVRKALYRSAARKIEKVVAGMHG